MNLDKKILFIHPPAISSKIVTDYLKYPPMGIAFLAAILRNNGYEPTLFDLNIEKNPFKKLEEILHNKVFQIIGISFSSINAEGAALVAKKVKEANPKSIVIAGGYHPSVMVKEVLADKNFDYVVKGEGEITLLELLDSIINNDANIDKILGVVFRRNGQLIINPPRPLLASLDTLPLPAYDLLNFDAYSSPTTTRRPYITYIRSRGCPFNCNFCGVQQMFTRKYRFESPQKTIDNIDELVNKFGVKEILFKDSEFVINQDSVLKFCDLLIKRKYNLVWGCNARADMVTESLLKKMKMAGCNQITYGIESGDQKILNRIRKGITLDQARNAVRLTKVIGIKCVTNFMFGNPDENAETMSATIDFAIELDPDYAAFNNLLAFPGSDVYDEAMHKKWFINGAPKSFTYESLRINATTLSNEEMEKFIKVAHKKFYFRLSYIWHHLRNLSWGEIKNNISGLRHVISEVF